MPASTGWTTICANCKARTPTMTAPSDSATLEAGSELVITRQFDAPRSLVFKAWTQPEHLVRWLGPKDFSASAVRIDLRPGGAWSAVITSAEGKSYGMAG